MRILITSIVDLKRTSHSRLHQFIRYLSKRHEVKVVSINDWWKAGQTDLSAKGFEDIWQDLQIEYITHRRISPIYQELAAGLGRILKRIDYQQFDLHLNYNSLVSGYFVSRKMRSVGVTTVYDIADDLPAMLRTSPQIPAPLRPMAGLFGRRYLMKNVAISSRVTITSRFLRDSLGILPSKAVVIPNGVDTDLFRDHPSLQLKRELGLERTFVLGYVGVLREWVDLEPLFSVVKNLAARRSNIKVLIVGEEGGLDRNKALAGRYGISERVIFTGTVPYTRVPEYISCIDVCLIPFKKDAVSHNAVPLKLFEYMACKKPVVSTRLRGVMEAAGERVLYFSDSLELEARIKELWESEPLRRQLGVEGRGYVERDSSWSKICSQLEGVLEEVSKR